MSTSEERTSQRALWLPKLAHSDDMAAAASALHQIDLAEYRDSSAEKSAHSETREQIDERKRDANVRAISILDDQLDDLTPRWIARFLELIAASDERRRQTREAIKAKKETPPIDVNSIIALLCLREALRAVGSRIDPYLGPIIEAFGAFGRDGDHELAAVLEYAGPAVCNAVPKLLNSLQVDHIWHWPSHVARAFANAAQYDTAVLALLQELLSSPDSEIRRSAMSVLGQIGPAAATTAPRLLAFAQADDGERCEMISALAQQKSLVPEFLDVLDHALRDPNGYVRRTAAYALSELTVAPERFIPLLIRSLDWTEHLHDTSLPEAAARTLGKYGPAAASAIPRLKEFLAGPIKGRTVDHKTVRRAIEGILGHPLEPELLVPIAAPSADPLGSDEPLFAVRYQGKQCYIDRHGHLAIQSPCAYGEPFTCGRAIIRDDDQNRSFVIDRRGQIVFEITWDEIKPFTDGLAAVKKADKWGFVDLDGRIIVEPQYDSVTPFSEGLAGIEIGRTQEALGARGSITWSRAGIRGYINHAGRQVIPPRFHAAQAFHDGRAIVSVGGIMKPNEILDGKLTLQDQKYGYIDQTGTLVIPGTHMLAQSFSEGLAIVIAEHHPFYLQHGYIDINGNLVIPQNLTSASRFKNGLAVVKYRGRARRSTCFILDRTGAQVAAIPLDGITAFSEGLASAHAHGASEDGYVDLTGRWIIEPQFDDCLPFENGLAAVQRGDWYAMIDRTGAFIWGPTTEGGIYRILESEWT